MSGTSQYNGVIERHNHTFMDTVKSMLSLSLWMETLKIDMYLLTRVTSKVNLKTPFEL